MPPRTTKLPIRFEANHHGHRHAKEARLEVSLASFVVPLELAESCQVTVGQIQSSLQLISPLQKWPVSELPVVSSR